MQGRGSIRNPPPWSAEIEQTYPFRLWVMDCITWCLSTDVDEVRKGPQIELALGGVARDLVREIDLQIKINGGTITTDTGAQQQLTGAAYILHVLSTRFMPLPEEVNVRAVADFHGFNAFPANP